MITLKVTDLQYEIIKAAVSAYTHDIMRGLGPEEPPINTVTVVSTNPAKVIAPWNEPDAPYGLKKDGTPKARPGRKSGAKVVRKTRRGRA